MSEPVKTTSEPKVTMSAVKLDRDGNVVEHISFDNVEVEATPGFFEEMRRAVKEGWEAKLGKQNDKGEK